VPGAELLLVKRSISVNLVGWMGGLTVLSVLLDGETDEWIFTFDDSVVLRAAGPWRILKGTRIALGSCDHQQQFGLPEPIDAASEALSILSSSQVASARLSEVGSDLYIHFHSGHTLEIINPSSGYEGWCLSGMSHTIIALGGGDLCQY
jgi:Family of unknown function (DUF6188)